MAVPLLPRLLRAACVAFALSAPLLAESQRSPGGKSQSGGGRPAAGAPEMDPGLAAAGLFVLVGGTLVLTGRQRPATGGPATRGPATRGPATR
jgi:hypothetical protein